MEEFFGLLAWLFVELLLVGTGKVIVTVASFGRWRSERIDKREGRIFGPAGALSFKREGQRVITATGLLLVGLIFYVGLAVFLVWVSQR